MNYHTKIIKELDDALIEQWKTLWKHAENANIFNSYEWFLTSQKSEKLTDYEIHICLKDDKLVAILPLRSQKQFGLTVWGVVGKEFLVDTAFLIEKYDKELFKQFFSAVFVKKNVFIQKIDSEATKLLHTLFPQLFLSLMSVNPCVYIKEDPLSSVSKSTVSQIKKMIRKNPEQVSFTLFSDNLQKHLETVFQIDLQSGKRAKSMDIFSKEENKHFFKLISEICGKNIRIGFLNYDNKPVAYQFGFVYRDTFIAYQTSYLNEYRHLRPGKTMLIYLLESLKDTVNVVDLGGGISTYKQEFTPDYRILYNASFSKNIFVMWYWKIINFARRKKQIYLPIKNTRDHEFLFQTYPFKINNLLDKS